MTHYHAVRLGTDERIIGQDTNGYADQLDAQSRAREMLTAGVKQTGWIDCDDSSCPVQDAMIKRSFNSDGSQRKERITICAVHKCKTGAPTLHKVDTYLIPLCAKHIIAYSDGQSLHVKFVHNGRKLEAEISNEDDD